MSYYHNLPFGFSGTGQKSIYTTTSPSNFYNLSPLELANLHKMDVQPSPFVVEQNIIDGDINKDQQKDPTKKPFTPTSEPIPKPTPEPIPGPAPETLKVDKDKVRAVYNKILTYYNPDSYYDEEKKRIELTMKQLLELFDDPYKKDGYLILKNAEDYLKELEDTLDRTEQTPAPAPAPAPTPAPVLPPVDDEPYDGSYKKPGKGQYEDPDDNNRGPTYKPTIPNRKNKYY